ncbi:MAG: sugar phosphate isomerase/epimerase [Bryobacteraceae bacterium]
MITRRAMMAACAALPAFGKKKFAGKMGLEIYSLRGQAEKDLPGTLALIRKLGFEELEVGTGYGRTAKDFRRLLDDNGLKVTSMMAEYANLGKKPETVIADAHTLGAEYVVCSTIPHKGKLTPEEIYRAVGDFSKWGETLSRADLRLCYHTHGVEFNKSSDGTLFDGLVKRTDPKLVNYEMDIFWIVYAFQDPVKMLERYPGRFPLMHVKDMSKSTVKGGLPADVREEESVPIGQGAVDIPAVLRAAQKTGVKHYYIEDEAVNAAEQIPVSLRYLEKLEI